MGRNGPKIGVQVKLKLRVKKSFFFVSSVAVFLGIFCTFDFVTHSSPGRAKFEPLCGESSSSLSPQAKFSSLLWVGGAQSDALIQPNLEPTLLARGTSEGLLSGSLAPGGWRHRISVERIISGLGIANIYAFLAEYEPEKVDPAFHGQAGPLLRPQRPFIHPPNGLSSLEDRPTPLCL